MALVILGIYGAILAFALIGVGGRLFDEAAERREEEQRRMARFTARTGKRARRRA